MHELGIVKNLMSKYKLRLSSYCCLLCHVRVMSRFCQGHVRVMSGSCQCYINVTSKRIPGHARLILGSWEGQFEKNYFLSNIAQPWRLKGFSVLFS